MSQDEAQENFFEVLVKQAMTNGAVVLEAITCQKCGKQSLAGHHWQETVRCEHCKQHTASRVPRIPAKGEVTLEHMQLAVRTLIGTYANVPNCKFVSDLEWRALEPSVQTLLTVNMSAAAIAVLKQVESLATGLASV